MRRSHVARFSLSAAGVLAVWCAAPGAGAQSAPAPSAEAVYTRAVAAMKALPEPAGLAFDLELTSETLRAACRGTAQHRKFAVDFGRTHGRYHVVYTPATDLAETEDAATHERCDGAPFAPVVLPRSSQPMSRGNVQMEEIVRAATLDEPAKYAIALKQTVPDGDHADYVLTFAPRDGGDGDHALLREMTVDGATWLVKEMQCRAGGSSWAGGARLDFRVAFGPLGHYWVVNDFVMNGSARAFFVSKRFDISAHATNYEALPARTQAAGAH